MAVSTVITMLMIRLQNMFLFSAIIVKILGYVLLVGCNVTWGQVPCNVCSVIPYFSNFLFSQMGTGTI